MGRNGDVKARFFFIQAPQGWKRTNINHFWIMLRSSTPPGYSKSQKYVLCRACKSYVVEGEQLFYVHQWVDGSTFNRLVIRGREEAERVFMEWHLTAGGHRGRDATVGKIKGALSAKCTTAKGWVAASGSWASGVLPGWNGLDRSISTNCRWAQVCANHDRLLQQVCWGCPNPRQDHCICGTGYLQGLLSTRSRC